MAKITLKPLDDGQRAVEIPVGKTTIGRGPFLGCSDKKVSRNHAVLEVTNKGEVFLTPTHVNPCFYQPTADSPGQILKKDIPHKLENGDSFSLLPRAFRYQLIVTGENDEKKDQNDLNKQTGKTNGAAGEGEEAMLNERNKDGKGLSSEDLNDANTVTEKAFSKDDDILANIDKNYSKEDNTFAKKIADIDDMSLNIKDSKETKEDRSTDKDKSDISKQDANKEELQDLSDNEKNKDETNESKISESCTEDKAEDKQKFSEKVIEENESTLGNDAFSKEKMENDHLQSSEKSESKSSQEKSETKKSDSVSASNGDEILDSDNSAEHGDLSVKVSQSNVNKFEDMAEMAIKNLEDTVIANTSYLDLFETYQESKNSPSHSKINMNLSGECNMKQSFQENSKIEEYSQGDVHGHFDECDRKDLKKHFEKYEEHIIKTMNELFQELIETVEKDLASATKTISENTGPDSEGSIEETLEKHLIRFQSISNGIDTVMEMGFHNLNSANIPNLVEESSTKTISLCISVDQNETACHPQETGISLIETALSSHHSFSNMEETDDEPAPAHVSDVDVQEVHPNHSETAASVKNLQPTTSFQSHLKNKSRKRKRNEQEENSELKELINTNKKIEENLLKIREEIKRRNDLQEEMLQLKRKKLKLMCLSANETKDFEEDKSRKIPDWIKDDDDEEDDKPRPKRGRKRGAKKGQVSEKKTAKRKQEDDTEDAPPKTKSRKKRASPKFSFDEGESSSQRHTPGRTSSRTNRQTRQGLSLEDFIVSDDDEWQSDRSSPKPRKRRGRKKRDDDSGSDWEVEHKKTKKVTHKFGSGSESGSDWGSQKKKKGGRRRKPKQDESDVASDEEVDQPGSDSEKKNRIACTYGKKCYRRNQNHLDQFSHPGDSDYDGSEAEAESQEKASEKNDAISESEDDEGSKKECPFGANCFRKNPQHKRDFKHTKKVRPKREAAKQAGKKAKGSRSSDEVDSYDLNESLLNDDSDEYKPVDSGSDFENSEKTKRLAKGKGAKNKRGRKV